MAIVSIILRLTAAIAFAALTLYYVDMAIYIFSSPEWAYAIGGITAFPAIAVASGFMLACLFPKKASTLFLDKPAA